jgi:hypothetical protein
VNDTEKARWAAVYEALRMMKTAVEEHAAAVATLRAATKAVEVDVALPSGVTEDDVKERLLWPVGHVDSGETLDYDFWLTALRETATEVHGAAVRALVDQIEAATKPGTWIVFDYDVSKPEPGDRSQD